jgi:hypothetical protein
MTLYEELDTMFPSHSYFYSVSLTDMNEALEKCARLTDQPTHVFTYSGQMIMSVQHSLGNDIPWLTAVPGSPEEE